MLTIIDMKCAKTGSEIAEAARDETLITKALGVLQEDGVYAFFLYLASKKNPADQISRAAFTLLTDREILGDTVGSETEPLKAVREKIGRDLDQLMFVKELLERTLVYARYHVKALGGE